MRKKPGLLVLNCLYSYCRGKLFNNYGIVDRAIAGPYTEGVVADIGLYPNRCRERAAQCAYSNVL